MSFTHSNARLGLWLLGPCFKTGDVTTFHQRHEKKKSSSKKILNSVINRHKLCCLYRQQNKIDWEYFEFNKEFFLFFYDSSVRWKPVSEADYKLSPKFPEGKNGKKPFRNSFPVEPLTHADQFKRNEVQPPFWEKKRKKEKKEFSIFPLFLLPKKKKLDSSFEFFHCFTKKHSTVYFLLLQKRHHRSLSTVSSTFHSLFKVLLIFRSRYLFAIGLRAIFSFRRNLPPILGYDPK